MTLVKYRLLHNRNGKLDKNGMASVVIEAYQNPLRRIFPTGQRCKPDQWNPKKNEVKGNSSASAIMNQQIEALRKFELRFESLHGRPFTLADFDLMKAQDESGKSNKRLTLSAFMLERIERDRNKLSKSAYYRYTRTVGNLVAYNDRKPVEFGSMNYAFVDGFDCYLRTVKHYHQNTIYKEHQVINQYLTRAAHMDLVKPAKNPYLLFKSKKVATQREVLFPYEIARLEELTFTADNQHLEFYRDAFLFSVYSLLRISDLTGMRQRHLTATNAGLLYEKVSKKTEKTNSIHRLPLYDLHRVPGGPSKPEHLLQKYARTDNKPLFDRSDPILNKYVKKVMDLVGITKHVTVHTARHSGITWLVILGLPLPVIQQLAQHSNITTTMQYVHLAEHITGERLSQVDWSGSKRSKE